MSEPVRVPQELLNDIAKRFSVGERFTTAVLARRLSTEELRGVTSFADLIAKFPPHEKQFRYALSTTLRGRNALDLLLPDIPENARRYLDVGCAYGGYLRAFAERGLQVCGVEIAKPFARLGRIYCEESGLGTPIIEADFLNTDTARLGTFDVITCSDVIEHVQHPQKALRLMSELLNENAVLFLAIPNRHCISSMQQDIHHRIFGIMLLPHYSAEKYHHDLLNSAYTIGEFYELEWYANILKGHGLDVRVSYKTVSAPEEVPTLMGALASAFAEWSQKIAPTADAFMAHEIEMGVCEYMERLCRDYRRYLVTHDAEAFSARYLAPVWQIIARRTELSKPNGPG